MATCCQYWLPKKYICGQFRDVIYKHMFVVTMFVDAISFASAHVVKIKYQTIAIPAKKKYFMSVGWIWIHNYPLIPKISRPCITYLTILNNLFLVTQFVFDVCYFELKSAGKQIQWIGRLQPGNINLSIITTPQMMSITIKLNG